MPEVAVVGAGIGGLTATVALRRQGIDAVAYEQTDRPLTVGAGLHLWSNAVKALDGIGLERIKDELSVTVENERFYTADGKQLTEWPVGDFGRKIGIPAIATNRPAVLEALVEAAGDAVVSGRRVTGFDQDDEGVTLRFAEGGEERCELLVGADGVKSTIRAQLFGDGEPNYLGYTSWRTLIQADRNPVDDPVLRQYWGRGARIVFFPAGPDGRLYFAAMVKAPPGGVDAEGQAKARLRSIYEGFADPVPGLIEAADEERLVRTDIVDRKPLRRWGKGRVTLLGDASHPMAPNTSQGAGMAIEDAVVLADVLSSSGRSPAALAQYAERRRKRAAMFVRLSRFPGTVGKFSNPFAVSLRDRLVVGVMFDKMAWRQVTKVLMDY
jgi:2-polyprenyl-6-methoxyphenol hydroxylase-like FAD-dependent oxidoreductase